MTIFNHTASTAEFAQEPLVSTSFLLKSLAFLSVMAGLTGGLVVAGHWLGQRINLAGHTDSAEIQHLEIGRDTLSLPSNVLRFETQRRSGPAERADLYLLWPEMEGFSREKANRFNKLGEANKLIFVQITQSVMSRDMSGRIEPIYRHYFKGKPLDAGSGLTMHNFTPEAGYQHDVLLTASRPGGPDYAVRCVVPDAPADATSGDCQRDFFAGKDLSVLYRFSSDLLPDWEKLDSAVGAYIAAHLDKTPGGVAPGDMPKMQ